MKKTILFALSLLTVVGLLSGCSKQESTDTSGETTPSSESSEKETASFPSSEEILEEMSPYLENAQKQEIEAAGSLDDFLLNNLGLETDGIKDAVLYLGMPNQNTTYFLMLTLEDSADRENINQKIEEQLKAWQKTAEMGYVSGYTEYKIIEKQDKLFAVMHEKQDSFEKMCEYLEDLKD